MEIVGPFSGAAAPIGLVNGDFEANGADKVAPPDGWTDLTATSFWTGVVNEAGNPTAGEAATAPVPGIGITF